MCSSGLSECDSSNGSLTPCFSVVRTCTICRCRSLVASSLSIASWLIMPAVTALRAEVSVSRSAAALLGQGQRPRVGFLVVLCFLVPGTNMGCSLLRNAPPSSSCQYCGQRFKTLQEALAHQRQCAQCPCWSATPPSGHCEEVPSFAPMPAETALSTPTSAAPSDGSFDSLSVVLGFGAASPLASPRENGPVAQAYVAHASVNQAVAKPVWPATPVGSGFAVATPMASSKDLTHSSSQHTLPVPSSWSGFGSANGPPAVTKGTGPVRCLSAINFAIALN